MTSIRLLVSGLLPVALFSACGPTEPGPGTHPSEDLRFGTTPVSVTRELPAFRFTDQQGRAFGREDLAGRVWVADFIFLRCQGPCPLLTQGMKELQEETAGLDNLHLVTFTVDPGQDTVEDLALYAREHGADLSRWHFLRGSARETRELMTAGFGVGDPQEPINHSTRFVLVDQTGCVRGYYHWSDEESRRRLLADLRALLAKEAL